MATNVSQYDQGGYTGIAQAHGASVDEHHAQLNALQGHLDGLNSGYTGEAANVHHQGYQDLIDKGRSLVNTIGKIQELTNVTNSGFHGSHQESINSASQMAGNVSNVNVGLAL